MTLSPWLPWFYQYGVGGLMAAGMVLLAWRAGALSLFAAWGPAAAGGQHNPAYMS